MLMFAEIYETLIISDHEIDQQITAIPPLAFRRLWLYLKSGKSLITFPKLVKNIIKNGNYKEPEFDDNRLIADGITDIWNTGLIGYELATITEKNINGEIVDFPKANYNSMTGIVTFAEIPLLDSMIDIDVYNDGFFNVADDYEYKDDIILLLNIAMRVIWEERFTGESLNRRPIIEDSGRKVTNLPNMSDKNQSLSLSIRVLLDRQMSKFQQSLDY